jgi:hypothetical protein
MTMDGALFGDAPAGHRSKQRKPDTQDGWVSVGGIPLFAVLGGIGWARINDALGPVVRDTEGRVFTLTTLDSMLEVAPFPGLVTVTP